MENIKLTEYTLAPMMNDTDQSSMDFSSTQYPLEGFNNIGRDLLSLLALDDISQQH